MLKKLFVILFSLGIAFSTLAQAPEESWKALNQKVLELYGQRRYVEAISYAKKMVKAVGKEFGEDHPDFATSLNNLALLYHNLGRYSEAEPLHTQAMGIRKARLGEEHPDFATSLNNLALLYESIGQYAEAEPFYRKALGIRKTQRGEGHPEYAFSLNNLAVLYVRMGRFIEAEPLMLKAMGIYKAQLGEGHPNYATSLNNLAMLYHSIGQYAEAEPLMIKAMLIRKLQVTEDQQSYAQSLNNLAVLYCSMGRYAEAEPLMIEATQIRKAQLGDDHPDYSSSLNNLGSLYGIMGLYAEAEPLFSEALEIYKVQLGEKHPDYATSLNNLAGLYKRMGRYTKAEPLYKKTIGIFKAQLEDHPNYAQSLNDLALLYQSLGQYAQAEPLLLLGQKVYFHNLRTAFPTLSEKEKEQFLNTFRFNFEIFDYFAFKRQRGNPAISATQYDNALLLKGLLLQSSSQMRERILASEDTTAISLFREWQLLKRQWLKQSNIPNSERKETGIALEATLVKANALEKELSLRSMAFAETTDTVRTTWRDVRRQLQPHEAAIELVRYRRWNNKGWTDSVHYAALIVLHELENHPHYVLLENGSELEERGAQSYQSAFATRGANRVADGDNPIPADSLYAYFWQPIQEALDSLGGARKVYLSADGVYHTLNLQTLKNPETGQYLLETLDIERVGSTRDLVKKKKQHPYNNNAVLAGYPSYPASPEAVAAALQRYQQRQAMPVLISNSNYGTYQTYRAIDANRSNISSLPGTLAEVEQLDSILEEEDIPTQVLLEDAASEDVLKKVKSPRILHIATHGFFEPESEQQAESLNREILMSGLGQETVSENPYLRCGLYLAGAETTLKNRGNPDFRRPAGQEDGILTAYEATLLDLRGTELVVLSACETGLGISKNGEGVYGLQRAFQVAGAETVIFSLWKVADEQTQEMMGLFYQNWLQNNMTNRQAFKAAQQTIKEKYEDPYYWGAFVMIGG